MSLRDLFRLIVQNLRRLKFRAAFSAIGVMIGTTAVVILIAFGLGLQQSALASISSSFGSLNEITVLPGAVLRALGGAAASSAGGEDAITPKFIDEMRRRPEVLAITPLESLSNGSLTMGRLNLPASVIGVDPQAIRGLGWKTQAGIAALGRGSCILGAKIVANFYDPRRQAQVEQNPEDLIGQTLLLKITRLNDEGKQESRTLRLRIAGVLEERGGQDDFAVFVPLDDAESANEWIVGRAINRARDGYSQAAIVPRSANDELQLESELSMRGFYAMSARTMLQAIDLLFVMIQAVLGGVGGIALIVAGVGIANTLTMAMYERTREIGLMKALGAANRDVMLIFLGEAGAVGLLGGAAGALLGILLSGAANLLYGVYLQSQGVAGTAGSGATITAIPLWLPPAAILFSAVIGVLSGLYPAQRAARLEPVDALKYE